MLTTITSKGQVTIPAEIRKMLNLRNGDKVNFVIRNDKIVEMMPVDVSIKALKGMGTKPAKPITIEEMDKAIGELHGRD